jgi:hypothetical protein
MSLRWSIQNAQDANQRLPSWAASGSTFSSSNSLRTGPLSPSYTRVTAIANWRSFNWPRQTFTASLRQSASKKKAAAYSFESQYFLKGVRRDYWPNRRFPRSAYAFFNATVFHFGSWKLFERSLSVADCSRFQPAIRHKPWRTVFFLSAR